MLWPRTVHLSGLVAAVCRAEEPELLQKRSNLTPFSAGHPFLWGDHSHVECPTKHERALGGFLFPGTCQSKKRLSSPREQTAGSGGSAGRGCPSLTQHFSGWWGVMAVEGTGQAASR